MFKWFFDFFKDTDNQKIIKDLDKKNKELVKEINNKGIKCIYKDYGVKLYSFFPDRTYKQIKEKIAKLDNNTIFIFIVALDNEGHQMCVAKIDNKLFTMNVYTDTYIKYLSDLSKPDRENYGTLNIENYGTFCNILPKSFPLDCSSDKSTYGYPCAFYANYFANFVSNNINKKDDFIKKIKIEFGTNGLFEQASKAERDRIIKLNTEKKKIAPQSSISSDENHLQQNDTEPLLTNDHNHTKSWQKKLTDALPFFKYLKYCNINFNRYD